MSRYLVFAAVSLSLLLSAISGTAIAVAFPVITSSFNASLVEAGWVLTIFQVVSTAAMPLAGKASDVFGKKLMFMISLLLFTIGSVLCALASNIQLLILARFVQAVGGGGFLPIASGIVAETFPKSRQQIIGFFTSIFPIGQIIGPNVGGWLVSSYGWQSVFWFNVPVGVLALVVSAILLHPGRRQASRHIDLTGAGLFTGALFALLSGLSGLGNGDAGISPLMSALLLALAGGLTFAFIRHVRTAKDPIINIEVLRAKPFVAANIFNTIFGAALFGVIAFSPLYAISVYGMSILESGLIMTPRSVSMMIASTIVSVFLVRWGYRRPMLVGTIALALSLVFFGMELTGTSIGGAYISGTVLLTAVMFLTGLGTGVAAPAANNACIELMPEHIASISGVRGMFRQTGGAISIALMTVLLQNSPSMARGFTIAFFGLAGLVLASLPLIFAMPRAPYEKGAAAVRAEGG